MKRLTRIIMVNWYLFDAKQWDVKGDVALIGKNGSGKSSFIDALQLVLLGGNKTDWFPNAKASEKKKSRDVRSYILGLIKDEEAISNSTAYQPRDNALCRIVLVFKDDETHEEVSIGAALSARKSDPDETVEGYFIIKGRGLQLDDVLEDTSEGKKVKPFEQLRVFLRQQVEDKENDCRTFGKEPTKFVEQMLRTLGTNQRPPSLNKYRRAFKQSINLSGLEGSVSDFVKFSILESQPLNLEQMRQSIASYQNKKDAVERVNRQINDLKEIQGYFRRAYKNGQNRAGYAWCMEELALTTADNQIESWREQLSHKWVSRKNSQQSLKRVIQEKEACAKDIERLTITINKDESEAEHKSLTERISMRQNDIKRIDDQILRLHGHLTLANEALRYKDILTSDAIERLTQIDGCLKGGNIGWPLEPEKVDYTIKYCREHFANDIQAIDQQRIEDALITKGFDKERFELQQRVSRLESGQADLQSNTQLLITALADEGITATPICELAEIKDERWQPAIEAYLKSNTEALIVPPDQAKDAIEIYRHLKKQNIYGATVINTQRVQDWNDTIKPNTAADLIKGSNSLAVKYLQRLLNNIELSDKTDDFMKQNRALTKDGMFISQAGVKRLRKPMLPKMGAGAIEKQKEILQKEVLTLIDKMQSLQTRHNQYVKGLEVFNKLYHYLNDAPVLLDVISEKIKFGREIDKLEKQLNAIDVQHLDSLKKDLSKLRDELKDSDKQSQRLAGEISTLKSNINQNIDAIRAKQKDIPLISARRSEHKTDEDYSDDVALNILEKLESELETMGEENFETLKDKVRIRIEAFRKKQITEDTEAKNRLAIYKTQYRTEMTISDALSSAGFRAQIETYIIDLEGIGLQKYQQAVVEAMDQVIRVVRQDLAIRLKTQISKMKNQFSELNKELKARPFSSNQIYQFRHDQLSEYREFLHYVDTVTEHTSVDVGSLFDEHSHLNDYIKQLLDEEHGDTLSDYRNYFKYDIEIQHPEDGINELLSRRMGNASGGEHKTPYYVAMGAALASAYRLERKSEDHIDGGLALYLADEAFEKMDHANTVQAANYLKSIGLQLFIAAPDDAEPKLRQIVDTVLYFMREGNTAEVTIDYVMPEARKLLAQLNSDDIEEEKDVEVA